MKKINLKINKLNLGSGNEYRKGWINIDFDPKWKPDILCDIEKGIPLKDNFIEKVFIKHVLEHIDPRKTEFVMSELHRISKNGALIKIYVPYFSCSITYKTIDHISFYSYYTLVTNDKFEVVKKRLNFFRRSFGYENKVLTNIIKIINPILSLLPNSLPLIYERFLCWTFPCEELEIILKVRK